ncbi:hypothetical protein FBU59_002876 [Linderina macrospora]|uniref:Uncharacterized protein n=1 Tax=Linderina macrospora TaxID=4868 RepID=A0ACC1JA87_9FUNG|nr:hypothetical protein FBU59_002876 [Linderina macrospora]
MKFTAIVFLAAAAAAALAQEQTPVPDECDQNIMPTPPTSNVAPQPRLPSLQPNTPIPNVQPNIPIPNVEVTEPVQSAVARLASFFDFSHVTNKDTYTPVVVEHVFDPATRKFTHLSYNVVQNGDAYYVPVCSVDSIVQAGSSAVLTSDSCLYGIQLTPVPRNAARLMFRAMRTVFRLVARVLSPFSMFSGGQPGATASAFGIQFI